MSDQQQPSIGRIVHYRLSEADVKEHDQRLNGQKPGDLCPAMIVRVFSTDDVGTSNLRVFPDGPRDTIWKTSVTRGSEPGQWDWPARV